MIINFFIFLISEIVMSGDFSALREDDWYNLFCKTCEALVATNQLGKAVELVVRVMRPNYKDPDRQPLTTDAAKKEVCN